MSDTKHTPGPWTFVDPPETGKLSWVHGSNDKAVADITTTAGRDTMLADGRLIAAAPELLQVLRAMADGFEVNYPNGAVLSPVTVKQLVADLRALIAKAEGKG